MHTPRERAVLTSVFPGSFPRWTISEVCSVRACLTAPTHLYLVVAVVVRLSLTRTQQAVLVLFLYLMFFFFSMWVFFHEHSRITGLQGKGEGISLTPQYHFPPLHRHLDISRAITAESSPLHIASSRTRTGNLWFPSASR